MEEDRVKPHLDPGAVPFLSVETETGIVITHHHGKGEMTRNGKERPCEGYVHRWKMYQYDYDSEAGVESKISVLQLVKDPWLPFVYAGIFMMLAGAFLMMIVGFKKEESK